MYLLKRNKLYSNRHPLRCVRGSAYILILGASLMLITIAMGALLMGRNAIQSARASATRNQLQLSAQSGVELALQYITAHEDWRADADSDTLFNRTLRDDEEITVDVYDPEGDKLSQDVCAAVMLESYATSRNGEHIVEVELESDAIGNDPLESATLSLDPIGWWRLADTNGVVIDTMDLQDGEYLGTYTQGIPVPTRCDRSVYLNGNSGRITIPHNSKFLIPAGSVSFWFQPLSSSGTSGLICKLIGNLGTSDTFFCWYDSTTVKYIFKNSYGYTFLYYTMPSDSFANQWHHVVLTFGDSDGTRLYVDGELVMGASAMKGGWGGDSYGSNNTANLRVGVSPNMTWDADGYAYPFQGMMDEVALFEKQLSKEDVALLYDAGTQANHTMHVLQGSWRQLVVE